MQLGQGDILADGDAQLDLHAGGQDGVDVLLQLLTGQAVAGNAVAQHAAQLLAGLIYGDLVSHKGEVVGCGQAAGAAADDCHCLPGGLGAGGRRDDARVVHRVALEATDVHRALDHVPAAAGLAGVLAHQAAGAGEWVVLADQTHGVCVAAGAHQGHIAGDIHAGGALGHAGHRLIQVAQAPAGFHMGLVVVPESADSLEHHAGRLVADGAVGAVGDHLGGGFNKV